MENKLAISIVWQGGIGIIYKNMMIEQQVEQVCSVKCFESGMIVDLVMLEVDVIIGDVFSLMWCFKIGGIFIVDKVNKLVGILINWDLCFEICFDVFVWELMIKDNFIIVFVGINLEQACDIFQGYKIEKFFVVDDN